VGGLAMVGHVLKAAAAANVTSSALVVGADSAWTDGLEGAPAVFVQEAQLGTAHAVLTARDAMGPQHDAAVVLYGDNPLITPATIARVLARVREGADVAVIAFRAEDPTGYGRILMADGQIVAIREERDASPAERAVTLCNSGVMAIRAGAPFEAIGDIGNDNAKGEYYLTDMVALARAAGLACAALEADADEVEWETWTLDSIAEYGGNKMKGGSKTDSGSLKLPGQAIMIKVDILDPEVGTAG
ncbi:MAG: NTP transferase domain-containing protein, partial [Planctomycetota bacterium]